MLRTKTGLPKHCVWIEERRGKHTRRRVRFRLRGVSAYPSGIPWSPEFMTAYAAALERATTWTATTEIGASKTKPGSINELIVSYYKFVFPTRLRPSTQATWRGVLERFRKDFGDDRVADFERKHIVAILNNEAQRASKQTANKLRKVLRLLFEHAIDINLRSDNPVIGTKRFKVESEGHHTWTPEEVAQYRAHWRFGTAPRLCMELAFELAARRAEIVTRGPQHERLATPKAPYGKLFVQRLKGSNDTLVPISAELRAAIDACAPFPHLTYLATKNGKARSYKSLTGDFRTWCDAAGLPKHCRLHGLKKSALTALAQGGASIKQMQSVSGHKSLAVLQGYIEKTNQEQLAEEAMAMRNKERSA